MLDAYLSTVRVKVNQSTFPEGIYLFWHSKMLIGWRLFKGKNFNTIVSKSKDGEILTNILTKWDYFVARGSTSKDGKEALGNLISEVKKKHFAALTPDGPRGPAMEIKNGALSLAFKTGLPLIPVRINYSKKKKFIKSWDKFELPYAFTKCEVTLGKKHFYNNILEGEELNTFKNLLKSEMN